MDITSQKSRILSHGPFPRTKKISSASGFLLLKDTLFLNLTFTLPLNADHLPPASINQPQSSEFLSETPLNFNPTGFMTSKEISSDSCTLTKLRILAK